MDGGVGVVEWMGCGVGVVEWMVEWGVSGRVGWWRDGGVGWLSE